MFTMTENNAIEINGTFSSFERLNKSLTTLKKDTGFDYTIKTSRQFPNGHSLKEVLKYENVTFHCPRSGIHKSKGDGKRQIESKKCDCKASIKIVALRREKMLKITEISLEHTGHEPMHTNSPASANSNDDDDDDVFQADNSLVTEDFSYVVDKSNPDTSNDSQVTLAETSRNEQNTDDSINDSSLKEPSNVVDSSSSSDDVENEKIEEQKSQGQMKSTKQHIQSKNTESGKAVENNREKKPCEMVKTKTSMKTSIITSKISQKVSKESEDSQQSLPPLDNLNKSRKRKCSTLESQQNIQSKIPRKSSRKSSNTLTIRNLKLEIPKPVQKGAKKKLNVSGSKKNCELLPFSKLSKQQKARYILEWLNLSKPMIDNMIDEEYRAKLDDIKDVSKNLSDAFVMKDVKVELVKFCMQENAYIHFQKAVTARRKNKKISCKKCHGDINDKLLAQCKRCLLSFHLSCTDEKQSPKDLWYCSPCRKLFIA